MKHTFLLALACVTLNVTAQFSKTLILQPDSCQGKDAVIGDCVSCGNPNANFGNHDDFLAASWTVGGNPSNTRALLAFDLSAIPAGAPIISAQLSLYHNPSSLSGNIGHSQNGGSNAGWLKRISTAWDEMTVTWNNQPSTTTQNQVNLSASSSNTQDYLNIDVQALIQDMVNAPGQNNGFMLQLQTESPLRSLLFASSDHANSALHPRLVVVYEDTTAAECISLQPHNTSCDNGIDAVIGDCVSCGNPNSNFGSHDDMIVASWTVGGNPSNTRALLNFDLSAVPANAVITSASLSLYHNPNSLSGNIGHSQNGGSNAAWLRRVTSAWTEYGVTWNSQPTTSTQNQVVLPASNSTTEDYLNIDVAALVQDIVSNPAQSFGMMIQLQTESPQRSLLFASSDHANPARHPQLDVCYTFSTGTRDVSSSSAFAMYPNPTKGSFRLKFSAGAERYTVSIYNAYGALVYETELQTEEAIIQTPLSAGLYTVRAVGAGTGYMQKLVVE